MHTFPSHVAVLTHANACLLSVAIDCQNKPIIIEEPNVNTGSDAATPVSRHKNVAIVQAKQSTFDVSLYKMGSDMISANVWRKLVLTN